MSKAELINVYNGGYKAGLGIAIAQLKHWIASKGDIESLLDALEAENARVEELEKDKGGGLG